MLCMSWELQVSSTGVPGRAKRRCYRGALHSPWCRTWQGLLGEGALLAPWGAVICWRRGAEPDRAGLGARGADRWGGAAAFCDAAEALCIPISHSGTETPRPGTCMQSAHTHSASNKHDACTQAGKDGWKACRGGTGALGGQLGRWVVLTWLPCCCRAFSCAACSDTRAWNASHLLDCSGVLGAMLFEALATMWMAADISFCRECSFPKGCSLGAVALFLRLCAGCAGMLATTGVDADLARGTWSGCALRCGRAGRSSCIDGRSSSIAERREICSSHYTRMSTL